MLVESHTFCPVGLPAVAGGSRVFPEAVLPDPVLLLGIIPGTPGLIDPDETSVIPPVSDGCSPDDESVSLAGGVSTLEGIESALGDEEVDEEVGEGDGEEETA